MLEENLTCSKLSNSSTENNGGYSPLISKLFNASKYMSSLKSGAWIKTTLFSNQNNTTIERNYLKLKW